MTAGPALPLDRGDAIGLLSAALKAPLALAVSGGADSTALMHLVHRALSGGPSDPDLVRVLTVDHQLRAESAEEAASVACEAQRLGFSHETLVWEGTKPTTALQASARDARYDLMIRALKVEACECGRPPRSLLTAHHADDQAETLMMRLKRGSGLTGLAAMRAVTMRDGVEIKRPLLSVPKARLVATLQSIGAKWCEDPSNGNDRFERVRIRKTIESLAAHDCTPEAFAESAARLARADDALNWAAQKLSQRAGVNHHGGAYAAFDRAAFLDAPYELRMRLVASIMDAHGGISPRARLAELEDLVTRLSAESEGAATLGGCQVRWVADRIQVFRESGRAGLGCVELKPGGAVVWDNRFDVSWISGGGGASTVVGPLGISAYATLKEQADLKLPSLAGAALPAIFDGSRLVAVPYFDANAEAGLAQLSRSGIDPTAREHVFQCRSTFELK